MFLYRERSPVDLEDKLYLLYIPLFLIWEGRGLLGDPGPEDFVGRAALHPAAAVWPLVVVGLQVSIQVLLHLRNRLVPGRPALDPEVLFEERAVEPLDEAVGLGSADLRGAVLDVLELQEELVGVLVGSAAVLAAVVAQDRPDLYGVLFEEGQRVVVQDLNRGHRHLAGIVPPISLDSSLATLPGSRREEARNVSEYKRAGFDAEPRQAGRPAEAVEREGVVKRVHRPLTRGRNEVVDADLSNYFDLGLVSPARKAVDTHATSY